MNEINEMIISLYDCLFGYSVFVNGKRASNEYDIVYEFDSKPAKAIEFKEKYNIRRLIVCEDGGIEIYE